MKSLDWNPVEETYGEDGLPTEWVAKLKGKEIYMEKTNQGKFGLSDTKDVYVPYIKECKSYVSAKRWATRYQNRFFLDKDRE